MKQYNRDSGITWTPKQNAAAELINLSFTRCFNDWLTVLISFDRLFGSLVCISRWLRVSISPGPDFTFFGTNTIANPNPNVDPNSNPNGTAQAGDNCP